MNVTKLILNLESKLSSCTLDQQMISKAIQLLRLGAVEYVSAITQLPAASGSSGRLYFVEGSGLYWSTGAYWVPIYQNTVNTVWAWGTNTVGQLGTNDTTIDRSSPVSTVDGFTDWCQVASGCVHSVGLRTNGTVWSWGCNAIGRLGDGTTVNKSSPVSVVGGFTDWCQISATGSHNLGVRTNGTAWAWGNNGYGRLGDGSATNRSSPVSVVGGFTDWCEVEAGYQHSLGIRTNGTIWAWGRNESGQLGDGTTTNRSSPVSVVGGFTDWCQASAGDRHSLGVRTNGTAWAWGCNGNGRLGNNSKTLCFSSPVSVVGGFTDWCQVSAGNEHSLGLRTNGTVWAWGCNVCGQLGDNTVTSRLSPVSVVGGFTDWCHISAGIASSAGLRTNGTAWTWGWNNAGQLGDNSISSRSSPVSVVGGITDWCDISMSRSTLVVRRTPV